MEKILSILLSVAGLCIFSSLFTMLFPDGKLKKVGEFVLSLSVALLFILAIMNHFSNISLIQNDIEGNIQIQENKTSQKELYEKTISKKITETLKKHQIEINSIALDSELDKEGYLVLKKLHLSIDKIYNKDSVKEILHEEYQIPNDIITFDDNREEPK